MQCVFNNFNTLSPIFQLFLQLNLIIWFVLYREFWMYEKKILSQIKRQIKLHMWLLMYKPMSIISYFHSFSFICSKFSCVFSWNYIFNFAWIKYNYVTKIFINLYFVISYSIFHTWKPGKNEWFLIILGTIIVIQCYIYRLNISITLIFIRLLWTGEVRLKEKH